jgi:LysR family transcriptional regulator, flagellar master operon regulator
MNLDDLHTFLEIIDRRSLAAAAARLHVTPSTVTARINALESQLGCQLLHRNKSGAELTSAGFKLQRYAELVTQLWRQARYELALPPGVAGICNVGIAFDLWREVGSRFLEHVRRQSPRIATALWPAEDRQLQRWLNIGLIDIAFCYVAQADEGYTSRLLFEDELVMVSTQAEASAEVDDTYIYVDHGDEFRRQHVEAFLGAGPSLVTIAASDWALEHLRQSPGKGYLPKRVAAPLLAAAKLHRVAGAPTFWRGVYLVERTRTVRDWDWYEAAVAAARPNQA